MSNIPRVTFGIEDNNGIISWYDENSIYPQVELLNEYALIDGTSVFKLNKRIYSSILNSAISTEIFRIDSDGDIIFKQKVKFEGESTIINSKTVTFEDEKIEVGLSKSFNIASVNVEPKEIIVNSISGFIYTFSVNNPVDKGTVYKAGDFVYFQNTYSKSCGNNTYIKQPQFQNSIKVLGKNTIPSGITPSRSKFQVWVAGNSILLDTKKHNIVVSKLSDINNSNSGIYILGNNKGNLVEGIINFDSFNNLNFDNLNGGINIGGQTTNISLKTDNDSSENILINNTQGTSNDAISLISNSGGIDFDAKKLISFNSEEGINFSSNFGPISIESTDNIDLRNNGKSIIKVESDKLISLKENNPITINHKSKKADDNLIISQTGNTKSSLVLLSEGNTNNAINLNSKNGGIELEAHNNILMNALNGNFSLTSGNTASLITKKGALTLQGNNGVDLKYGNISVLKVSSNNTVSMKNNNPVKIVHKSTSNAKDFTISQTGNSNSSLILSSEGTGTDALLLKTTSGGITMSSDNGFDLDLTNGDIQIETQSGEINIDSADLISLTADSASNFTTTTGELTLDGESGVDLNYNGTSVLKLSNNNTVTLRANHPVSITHSSNGSSKDFTISQKGATQSNLVLSSEGTSQEALKFIASAGGITNQFSTNKSYTIKNKTDDLRIKLTDNSSTPLNEKIEIINTNGTASNSINITSTSGSITLLSNNNIILDGTVSMKGETSFTSDRRLKNNISKFDEALDTVMKFEGVNFTWKKDKNNKKQYGFIAQQIQEIIPELVNTDENNGLSVNYIGVIPILVEAIKEQQKLINKIINKN